jgi:hypothetical protein
MAYHMLIFNLLFFDAFTVANALYQPATNRCNSRCDMAWFEE